MKQWFYCCLLFLAWSIPPSLQGQDIHFSQFYLSPLNLNPSLAGMVPGQGRATAVYRRQWGAVLNEAAYQTYGASYDHRLPTARNDYFGLGGAVWNDRAGEAALRQTQIIAVLNYHKQLDGGHRWGSFLAGGVYAGMAQQHFDLDRAVWGDQYDPAGQVYDPGRTTAEDLPVEQFLSFDFGAGLLWYRVDERRSVFAGAAVAHLNGMRQSFYAGDQPTLPVRFTLHAGAELPLGAGVDLLPGSVAFLQGASFELNGGAALRIRLNEKGEDYHALQLGAWLRLARRYTHGLLPDALIPTLRWQTGLLQVGLSYDINLSSLRLAGAHNGTLEAAIVYLIPGGKAWRGICPTFN